MKTAKLLSAVVAIVCIVTLDATPVCSQGKPFATRGVVELGGSVSYASFTDVSNGKTGDVITLFSFGPHIGYFPTDGFEIGFNPGITLLPGISILTPEKGDATTVTQLFFSPAYNARIEGSNVIPYIEVPLGYTSMSSGKTTQSGFSWGIKGGIKVIATGQMLLSFYGEFLELTFNPENPSPNASGRYGLNYLSFGVSVGGFF